MRVPLTTAVVTAALLFQGEAQADLTLAQRVAYAKAVVLVQVVESSYPPPAAALDYYIRAINSLAKLRVIRSWKGPYSTGATVTAETQQICGGFCFPYPFQVGQEVVVFTYDAAEPIHAYQGSVIDGSLVAQAIKELDALAVKAGP
jgi:hypothetical protein